MDVSPELPITYQRFEMIAILSKMRWGVTAERQIHRTAVWRWADHIQLQMPTHQRSIPLEILLPLAAMAKNLRSGGSIAQYRDPGSDDDLMSSIKTEIQEIISQGLQSTTRKHAG